MKNILARKSYIILCRKFDGNLAAKMNFIKKYLPTRISFQVLSNSLFSTFQST